MNILVLHEVDYLKKVVYEVHDIPELLASRGHDVTFIDYEEHWERRHKLDQKKAKAAAEKIARDLNKRFDLAYEWEGDHIAFERPGVSGSLHVGKTNVQLDVELSFLLVALKGPIEREIHKQLDAVFGEA